MPTILASLKQLIQDLKLGAPAGATDQELKDFEQRARVSLPDGARELFQTCNGLVFEEGLLAFESLHGALKYPKEFFTGAFGYLPFVDNNDSDPMCICCKSPLRGHVVQILHDDSDPLRVRFRSLESFLEALARFAKKPGRWDLGELRDDFSGPERTAEDVRVGRELLELASQIKGDDRSDAIRYAVQMFSEEQVDAITAYLQDEDEYVRESVRRRLGGMKGSRAAEALRRGQADTATFAEQCRTALKAAGINASITDAGSLRLDDGPVFLNLEAFFGKRHEPDFFEDLIQRSRTFLVEAAKPKEQQQWERRFELGDTFCSVNVDDEYVFVRRGKVGARGNTETKMFREQSVAASYALKVIEELTAQGYKEVSAK